MGQQASKAQPSDDVALAAEVALASQGSFGVVSGFEVGILSGTDEVAFFFVSGDGTLGRPRG